MRKILILSLIAALFLSCRGASTTSSKGLDDSTSRYGYDVVSVFPHSTKSYTQGLVWCGEGFYESVGEYGASSLLQVELNSGKALRGRKLKENYFGEGLALHKGLLYQLTWLEGVAFVYDPQSFELVGQINYRGEGWGLASDGERLFMSDGSDSIRIVNPVDFSTISSFGVRQGVHSRDKLNELEWVEGELWANVYMSDEVLRIDPSSGRVVGVIDFSALLPLSSRGVETDVLNGIAYDALGCRLFVTGKNWPFVYEVTIKKQ